MDMRVYGIFFFSIFSIFSILFLINQKPQKKKKKKKKKKRCFIQAGEGGDVNAMYNVGLFYELGVGGVEENQEEAGIWFMRAADGGSEEAEKKLQVIISLFKYNKYNI